MFEKKQQKFYLCFLFCPRSDDARDYIVVHVQFGGDQQDQGHAVRPQQHTSNQQRRLCAQVFLQSPQTGIPSLTRVRKESLSRCLRGHWADIFLCDQLYMVYTNFFF